MEAESEQCASTDEEGLVVFPPTDGSDTLHSYPVREAETHWSGIKTPSPLFKFYRSFPIMADWVYLLPQTRS